jgi:6-phosphogluconolactonase (cycloisomerase 2 family)
MTQARTVVATFTPQTFTVTPLVWAHGSLSPSNPQTVNYGNTTAFTVTPDTGYHISTVTGCGGSLVGNIYTTGAITADCTVTASFAITTFTITASAGANGSIAPSGAVTVNSGASQSFTITPNTGYRVADVLVDGSSVGAVTSFTFTNVIANHTIAASFTINPFTVTVQGAGNGNGTVTGGSITCTSTAGTTAGTCTQTVNSGGALTLSAIPSAGSNFGGWSGACAGSGPCSLTNITANQTVIATFFTLNPELLTVTLTGTGSGTVTSSPAGLNCSSLVGAAPPTIVTRIVTNICSATFPFGTSVMLTATPATGSRFAGWSGEGCSDTCVVSMTQSRNVTAPFIQQFTLTVNKAGSGSGTVTSTPPGLSCGPTCTTQTTPFDSGTPVTLTAMAACDSSFAGWSGGGCTGTGACSVTVTATITVTATFNAVTTCDAPIVSFPSPWGTGTTPAIPIPKFAYVANAGANDVSGFTLEAMTGALAPIGAPWTTGQHPASVTADPGGRFVYVANAGSNDISGFALEATTGTLQDIPGSPFLAGAVPTAITVDPAGRFVYVANAGANDVSGFTLEATTGTLQDIPGSPFLAGAVPTAITVDPAGRFVYVVNADSNDVSGFTLEATAGTLTSIGAPWTTGQHPASVTVDPSGRFVYVANAGTNDVSAFTIEATTGILTFIGSFDVGGSPASVTVDPSGQFAYVANASSNSIMGYRIDALTGALTSIGSSPVGQSPTTVITIEVIR